MKNSLLLLWFGGMIIIFFTFSAKSQEKVNQVMKAPKENYLIGEEKTLEIIAHVWGEVRIPGEKRVPDGTNVLELISKAGGPTEFSNLSKVLLVSDRTHNFSSEQRTYLDTTEVDFIIQDFDKLEKTGKIEIDINKYLKHGKTKYLPKLLPGDVVHVKRNVWFKWQAFFRVAAQVAIVAQVWYWYTRRY